MSGMNDFEILREWAGEDNDFRRALDNVDADYIWAYKRIGELEGEVERTKLEKEVLRRLLRQERDAERVRAEKAEAELEREQRKHDVHHELGT